MWRAFVLTCAFIGLSFCGNNRAAAQTQYWDLQKDNTVYCTNLPMKVTGGLNTLETCNHTAFIVERGGGWLFRCDATTKDQQGVDTIGITGGGTCRPYFTPSTKFNATTVYNGAYTSEGLQFPPKPGPPAVLVAPAYSYWVVQTATYEVYVCVRQPDGAHGCFPVTYDVIPIP